MEDNHTIIVKRSSKDNLKLNMLLILRKKKKKKPQLLFHQYIKEDIVKLATFKDPLWHLIANSVISVFKNLIIIVFLRIVA